MSAIFPTSPGKAKIVADRLRETISKLVIYSDEGKPFGFTVSIGISSSEISDNIDTLIKTADEALYRAKENGRNRCEVFTRDDLAHFHGGEDASHKPEASQLHPVLKRKASRKFRCWTASAPTISSKTIPILRSRKMPKRPKTIFIRFWVWMKRI